MATHPPGIVVDIVGVLMGDCGRFYEEHTVCGSVLEEDMVVCLWKVQVLAGGQEEDCDCLLLGDRWHRLLPSRDLDAPHGCACCAV